MVLSRVMCVMLAIAGMAGCNQSLFDAFGSRDGGPGGDDGPGGDGPDVPDECPARTCIADAARDFNGMQGGVNGHWRYFEDKRDRRWTLMTAVLPPATGMEGTEMENRIEPCTSAVAACQALPGALLVSSSGQLNDPAIEYKQFPLPQTIQLAVRVRSERGTHRVRLYRNSREDVLSTISAPEGLTAETTFIVDALTNDQFYVALEPTGGEGGRAAVQFFVIDTERSFPQTCQLAVPFTSGTGNFVRDLCGDSNFEFFEGSTARMPLYRSDPFNDPNGAAYFESPYHYRGMKLLDRPGPITVQFWVQLDPLSQLPPPDGWLFSDLEQGNGGGLGIRLRYDVTPPQLEAVASNSGSYAFQGIPYTNPEDWHLVRMIHAADQITICMDGNQGMTFDLPGPRASSLAPNFSWDGIAGRFSDFIGGLDDVRVFSEALSCN